MINMRGRESSRVKVIIRKGDGGRVILVTVFPVFAGYFSRLVPRLAGEAPRSAKAAEKFHCVSASSQRLREKQNVE
jgi:hypothetical protein